MIPRTTRRRVLDSRFVFLAMGSALLTACSAGPAVTYAKETRPAIPYTQVQATEVERISTAVPWPRGIVWHGGKLFVLARGVHRSGGGPQPDIDDRAGTIFEVDPDVAEPVILGGETGARVQANARVFAEPTSPPFRLWDRQVPPVSDTRTDRPYASLVYDAPSQSFFVLAYAGIDIPGNPSFRKNPTDAIHRYDQRTGTWSVFEAHDPDVVPDTALGKVIANEYFPHADPDRTAPPHGLANGPCGAFIAGEFLYVVAKENTALIQYPLRDVRRDPNAPPPRGKYIFRRSGPADDVFLPLADGSSMYVEGTSAVAAHGNSLYVGFRTTSQVVRFALQPNGDVVRPFAVEYLAQFDPFDPEVVDYNRSAEIIDMQCNAQGELFVALHGQGTVWKVPTRSPGFLDARTGTEERPYVNLRELTDHPTTRPANLCFDPEGNLYICTGNKDVKDGKLRGTIYRVRPVTAAP